MKSRPPLAFLASALVLPLVGCICGSPTPVDGADRADNGDAGDAVNEGDGGEAESGPVCGDRVVTPPEQCDDGNAIPGDGCEPDCTFTCAVDATCDDGNPCNGAETCALATHTCAAGTNAPDGTPCGGVNVCRGGACAAPTCGDGIVEPPEQCDDGNIIPGDGCEADCTFTCVADPTCDDGNPCNGAETCDLGTHSCAAGTNPPDGTSCGVSDICRGGSCVPPVCGDGIVTPPEQCDDANLVNGDGCRNDCTFTCTADPACDDGIVCNGAETCNLATHTCTAGTPAADGTPCGGTNVCRGGSCAPATCGDGIVQPPEDCDDANLTNGDGCQNDCTWTCTTDPPCDDGNPCNGIDTCDLATHTCRPGMPAADGTLCDADGNPATRDLCVRGLCARSVCGDGYADAGAGETCDDSNVLRFDGCDPACRIETTLRFTHFALLAGSAGCTDIDANPDVDNAIGGAFANTTRDQANMILQQNVDNGSAIILLALLDLDDLTGRDDPSLEVAMLGGSDAMSPFSATYDEQFLVASASVDASRTPLSILSPGSIVAGFLDSGPGTLTPTFTLAGSPLQLDLRRAHVRGNVLTDMALGRIDSIGSPSDDMAVMPPVTYNGTPPYHTGLFCGAETAAALDRTPFPSTYSAYCPQYASGSILDLLVGGCTYLGFLRVVNATQPDIDIEGDGLYSPALQDTDGDGIVDRCRDGSTGTIINGNDCAQDPRFDDAYSIGFAWDGIRVQVTGIGP